MNSYQLGQKPEHPPSTTQTTSLHTHAYLYQHQDISWVTKQIIELFPAKVLVTKTTIKETTPTQPTFSNLRNQGKSPFYSTH